MNAHTVLDYLYGRLSFERTGTAPELKLDRVRAFCAAIGNPQARYPIIHIAGTNGKGSTAAMLAAILQSAGYKTGLHQSPHLRDYTERARIDGISAPWDHLGDFITTHRGLIEAHQLSYFELGVAWSFAYFADGKIDVAVIETGLGGILDATNIVQPILSLITNISADHLAILGPELIDVARTKAGIIKAETPVVISRTQQEFADLFTAQAAMKNAAIFFADQKTWPHYLCQLQGDYQRYNLPGVLQAIELLRTHFTIPDTAIADGLAHCCTLTGFKARWQILQHNPLVIADGAHNKDGLIQVIDQLRTMPHRTLYAVLGCTVEKNIDELLSLWPKDTVMLFAQADIPRAMPAQKLFDAAREKNIAAHLAANVNDAYRQALAMAQTDDVIFIGGSLYLLGGLDALFLQQ